MLDCPRRLHVTTVTSNVMTATMTATAMSRSIWIHPPSDLLPDSPSPPRGWQLYEPRRTPQGAARPGSGGTSSAPSSSALSRRLAESMMREVRRRRYAATTFGAGCGSAIGGGSLPASRTHRTRYRWRTHRHRLQSATASAGWASRLHLSEVPRPRSSRPPLAHSDDGQFARYPSGAEAFRHPRARDARDAVLVRCELERVRNRGPNARRREGCH